MVCGQSVPATLAEVLSAYWCVFQSST
jgi:hypothetical protein